MCEVDCTCRRELKIIPAQVVVVEHRQHKYACSNCYEDPESTPLIQADAPAPLMSGSLAGASIVAHIMNQKYALALPLYRQEKEFVRMGVSLSRQTMSNWVVYCALNYLLIIYMALKGQLLKEEILHADDTTVQVLHEDGKPAKSKSYESVYRTSGHTETPVIIYEYQPTREYKHVLNFLKGFSGYLHTDGYEAYHKLPEVTVVGCFAHARRRFDEALTALPPDKRKDSEAAKGVAYCNKLFALERKFAYLERRFTGSLPFIQPRGISLICL